MTPERYEQVKAVFLRALDAQPADRSQIIDAACEGDGALRAEVERLLMHHEATVVRPAASEAATVANENRNALSRKRSFSNRNGLPEIEPGNDALPPGTIISDRYRIVSQLGRGGMGVVYRADDLKLDEQVAIKFLAPALSRHPLWIARMRQEVRMLAPSPTRAFAACTTSARRAIATT